MAGIFTLESSLNFIFHCPKFIVRKILNFLRCVGKKTALLQAEASACVSGLANVLFCALAVHYLVLFFLSFSNKLSTSISVFLHLAVTLRICLVADCGRFNCQTVVKFERAKSLAKCSKTAIRYMRC